MPSDQNFEPDDFRMPLGDHIEDLRKCIVRALIGTAIAVAGCFYFGFEIISWLAQPMLQVMRLRGYPEQLITTDATAGFGTYLRVSLMAALIVAAPWIIFQAWKFIATGLYSREKKIVYILAPFSTLMTFLAVMFVYYVLIPAGLWFFFGWADKYPKVEFTSPSPFLSMMADASGISHEPITEFDDMPLNLPVLRETPAELIDGDTWINGRSWKLHFFVNGREYTAATAPASLLSPLPNINEYVKFASMVCLGIVIAFQTPVVMLVIGWTGTIDPKWLKKSRRYALMVCALAGAVLTPNDPITMLLLGIPLYLLFELGLFLMTIVYREPEPFDPDDPLGIKAAGGGSADIDPYADDDYNYDDDHSAYEDHEEEDPSFLDDLPPEGDNPEDKNLGRSDDAEIYESTAAFDEEEGNSMDTPEPKPQNQEHNPWGDDDETEQHLQDPDAEYRDDDDDEYKD